MPGTLKIVSIVVIGPIASGKSAVCQMLSFKSFSSEYKPTVGVDFLVATDPENFYKFNLWDASGNPRYGQVVKHFADTAEILMVVINPLAENYFASKQQFLEYLQTNTRKLPYGFLVLFSHHDLWKNDAKIVEEFAAFKREFTCATPQRMSVEPVSAKELNQLAVLNILKELVKPVILQQFCEALTRKLIRFEVNASNRVIFKTHPSRMATVMDLKKDIAKANTVPEITEALINAATDIRRPWREGENKFGFTLFGKQFRSYKDSTLYKLIKADLKRLAPGINLEEASTPEVLLNHQQLQLVESNSFSL